MSNGEWTEPGEESCKAVIIDRTKSHTQVVEVRIQSTVTGTILDTSFLAIKKEIKMDMNIGLKLGEKIE